MRNKVISNEVYEALENLSVLSYFISTIMDYIKDSSTENKGEENAD
jgi:hypothetical protein